MKPIIVIGSMQKLKFYKYRFPIYAFISSINHVHYILRLINVSTTVT